MNRRPTVKEDLYELHHVPGTSGFWNKIRTELVQSESREPTPQPQGFPPINVSDNRNTNMVAQSHAPGYHGDSPLPPKGLPPITDEQTKHLGWITRPPNQNTQNQLICKMPAIDYQQGAVPNKCKRTNPIPLHRGMVEAVEEPSARKIERKKRIDNAINRVNKKYVTDPRVYQESNINERVDSKFVPTPPTCPKPKRSRKHSVVIGDAEKMLRERSLVRGEVVQSRPPAQVPEGCHSRLAAQIAAPIVVHGPPTSENALKCHSANDSSPAAPNCSAAPSVRSGVHVYDQRYAYGQSAEDSYRVCQEQGEACSNRVVAQTCDIPHSHGSQLPDHNRSAAPSVHSGVSQYNQRYVNGKSAADNYRVCGEQGEAYSNRVAAQTCDIPHSHGSRLPENDRSAAASVHSGVSQYNQRCVNGKSAADYYDTCSKQDDPYAPVKVNEWHQDSTNDGYSATKNAQQVYGEKSCHNDSGSVSSQVEIDLDVKRQQMLARKCIEKRRKEAALKKAEQQVKSKSESSVEQVGYTHHVYQPVPPSTRRPHDVTMEGTETDQSIDGQNQIQIHKTTKHTHVPTIRVEPQLTWNTSAAKRGLGFKSKLRREQEEAAMQNKGPDLEDAPRGGAGSATPRLTQEARRRWRNKTIFSQSILDY